MTVQSCHRSIYFRRNPPQITHHGVHGIGHLTQLIVAAKIKVMGQVSLCNSQQIPLGYLKWRNYQPLHHQ